MKRIIGNISLGRGEKGENGIDGREVQIDCNNTHIIWRYIGETENEWKDIVSLDYLRDKVRGSGSLTPEQLELLEQIPNKFDDVKVEIDEATQQNIIKFYSNGKELKEIRIVGGGSASRGTLTTTFENGSTVKQNEMVNIPFVFDTENMGEARLYVTIVNGQKTKELEFPVNKVGAGIAPLGILDKGINQISMYIIDAATKMTNIVSLEIICGALEITSTFDSEQDFNDYSAITIPVVVDALVEEGNILYANIDGKEITQAVNNGYNAFNFPNEYKTIGVHSLSLQVKNGSTVSNIIEFNIIIVNSTKLLISTKNTSLIFEEGVKFTVPYRISILGQSLFNVQYYLNGETDGEVQQVKIGANEYVADFSKFKVGAHTLKIVASTLDGGITGELSINITIVENSFKRIEFVKNGLEAFFDMSKNSNTSPTKNVLISECLNYKGQRYELSLHDYNYNTNGWIDGRLVSNGTAWAEINMKPFVDNVTAGFTFDISYSASNMGDDDNVVLECMGQEIPNGILITSAEYNIKTESNNLKGYYTNDKDTRVTFVVHRTSTYLDKWLTDELGNLVENPNPVRKNNPMVQVYIDGILSEVAMLSDSGTGANKIYESILNEETILINTDRLKEKFGVSKIKTIAIYNRPLEHEEVLQNLMADIDDLMEQKAKYDKNYVTINQDIPTIYINDSKIGTWRDTTKDNKQYLEVTYSSPNVEKFGPSFESISQTAWQGTSSLAYPVKNIKLKLYDYQTDEQGNPINTTDTKSFVKKKVDLFGARDGDGYAEQVFTIKVDYMDSSHCRNTGTARMTNDFLFKGNENPAKQIDPKTRDAINGVPVQIYINGEWIGLGNLNHDKSCFKSLGMETIPNTVRWEIKANTDTSEGAFFKTWEEGNIEQIYSKILADFEIVYDEDAFEENSGEFDLTKYYDELNIPYSGTNVTGGYKDYSILSLARYIQFVSDTTDKEEFRQKAPQYFNVDRACRYYLNVMLMGMIDNFAKNTIINMYGDDIWWYSFYDLDSQLSLDNTGYRKFREDIEPSHEGVYNCSTSKMWVKLNDFFQEELFNNFLVMRNGEYTYENICRYLIDLQIDQFPEIAYNRDIYAKYIAQGRRYLHMLHGNDKAHILRWLYNRFLYVDSLFLQQNSPYTKQSITIRSCKPTSGSAIENLPSGVQYRPKFLIETYTPQYVTICWRKNTYVTKRVGWGETVEFSYDMTNSQDNELIVYCAGNLKRIGSATDKNPTSIDIGSAFKLVEFECEGSDKLLKADLSKNSYLRKVSFNGCTNLGNTTGGANVLDVSSCTNLRTIDIRDTSITSLLTNTDGGNVEEIYYPSKIQNVVVANLTNLRVVGLPTGENIAENLSTVQIVNCDNIKTLKYPYNENDPIDFETLKYVQNLTIENSLHDMENLSFRGFNKLKNVTLKNMLKLKSCGFDDMLGADETPTLKNVSIDTCPLIETLTLKVSDENSIVAFDNAILDLRNATTIKRIESNTALTGLKSIYLPYSVTDLIFALDYHKDLTSDITNIWSSANVQENINNNYSGIDFNGLTIKNLDLSSLKKISSAKNMDSLKPVDILKLGNLSVTATVDLTNYTGSYVEMFKGTDLSNITFVCNKDITATDFTSMFEGAIFGENTDISPIMNRIKGSVNFTRLFAKSNVVEDVMIPSNVINVTEMYKDCTSITHIHSNWNNTYDWEITATDCYSGCTITHIDGENVLAYEGDNGLDYVPIEWGGGGFTADGTTIYVLDTSLGTSLTIKMCGRTDIQNEVMLINWGDGTPTAVGYTHTYAENGIYTVKVKGFIHGANIVSSEVGSNVIPAATKPCITNILKVSKTTYYNNTGYVYVKSFGGAFAHLPNLQTVDVSNWAGLDVGSLGSYGKNIAGIFVGCSSLVNIIGFNKLNLSNVTLCQHMFKDCSSLTSLDLSSFNTGSVTDMNSIFRGCSSLTSLDLSSFNTSNVTTMANMFNGCSSLTSLDLSSFDTSRVTSMGHMFQNCSSLTSLDLSSLNMNNVTQISYMFYNCSSLDTLDLSTLAKTNAVEANEAFIGCGVREITGLNGIKLKGNISAIFMNMPNIVSLDLSGIDTSKATHIANAHRGFVYDCPKLEYLNISGFSFEGAYVANWNNFGYFGLYCPSLKTFIARNCDTTNCLSVYRMFEKCANLTYVDVSGMDLSNVSTLTNFNAPFKDCSSIVDFISFKNISTSYDVFSSSLTVESLLSIIDNLVDTGESHTLKIGATNLAKLTSAQIKVATDKGWTVV